MMFQLSTHGYAVPVEPINLFEVLANEYPIAINRKAVKDPRLLINKVDWRAEAESQFDQWRLQPSMFMEGDIYGWLDTGTQWPGAHIIRRQSRTRACKCFYHGHYFEVSEGVYLVFKSFNGFLHSRDVSACAKREDCGLYDLCLKSDQPEGCTYC